ncbi:putative bifunctional diguanylate cyclase/phosphodiesterase [Bosea thiooxidans]
MIAAGTGSVAATICLPGQPSAPSPFLGTRDAGQTSPDETMDCDLSRKTRKTAAAGKAVTRPPPAAAPQNAWPGSMERDFVLAALDSAASVTITDISGAITFVNEKFCEISGYAADELLGSNHRILNSGTHPLSFFREMYRTIATGSNWTGEICNRRKNGSLYWVKTTIVPQRSATGETTHYVSIRFDVTARKVAEERLRNSQRKLRIASTIDSLTRLQNRRRFTEHLGEQIEKNAQHETGLYLAILDVDHFKDINDLFGHDVGDKLLQQLAARLGALEGLEFFPARLGGDEFAIVLRAPGVSAVQAVFETVLAELRRPFPIGGEIHRCSASVGIAAYPRDGDNVESLVKAADIALYAAKETGRDRISFFEIGMHEERIHRAGLEKTVEIGLDAQQFSVYYQPILSTDRSRPLSFEALLRWQHPQLGLISPSRFQGAFRNPGTAAAIGEFVLERATSDIATMIGRGLVFDRVAINVSNADFRQGAFADRLLAILAAKGIPSHHVSVEVTEDMFLGAGSEPVKADLERLHRAGIDINLDDFGTGYASLTHLRSLTFDRLKIDRSFVAAIEKDKEALAIVRGIVSIAHALGKHVTAEGVETIRQAHMVTEMGCDRIQGWLYAKAQPFEQLPHLIEALSGSATPIRSALKI